jgi:hypothetical protein
MVNMGLGSEFKVGVVAILNIDIPGLFLDFIDYPSIFRARCVIKPSLGRVRDGLKLDKCVDLVVELYADNAPSAGIMDDEATVGMCGNVGGI